MKCILKLFLVLEVLVVVGHADTQLIQTTVPIEPNGAYLIQNLNHEIPKVGVLTLAQNTENANGATLGIASGKSLTIKGGTLKTNDNPEENKYLPPVILLNGTMTIAPTTEDNMPLVNLNGAEIAACEHIVRFQKHNPSDDYKTLYTTRQQAFTLLDIYTELENWDQNVEDALSPLIEILLASDLDSLISTVISNWNSLKSSFDTLAAAFERSVIILADGTYAAYTGLEWAAKKVFPPSITFLDYTPTEGPLTINGTNTGLYLSTDSYGTGGAITFSPKIGNKYYTIAAIGFYDITATIKISPSVGLPGEAVLDLSSLRTFSETDAVLSPIDLRDTIQNINIRTLKEVRLPYNCRFTNFNLSKAKKVVYTYAQSAAGASIIIDQNIIQKGHIYTGTVLGDYKDNPDLGVTIGKDVEVDKSSETATAQPDVAMTLSDLTATADFNRAIYKVDTDDLDDEIHTLSGNTTYKFGFTGTKPIQISGEATAIFEGDNSDYTPSGDITVPDSIVFAGDNSLFPFDYTYSHLAFKDGQGNITNTVPSGTKITATSGLELGSGHTLIIKGTLIG